MKHIYIILFAIYLTISLIPAIQLHFAVNLVIALSLFGIMLVGKRKWDKNYMRWCACFFIFCSCSIMWAIDRKLSMYVLAANYVPVILTLLSVTMYAKSFKDVNTLMKVFYFACLLMFVFFASTVDLSDLEGSRLASNEGDDEIIWNPNYVAGDLVFAIYAGYFCFVKAKNVSFIIKSVYWIATLIMFFIVLLSGSRASLLLLLMPASLYYLMNKRITFTTILLLMSFVALLLFLVFSVPVLYSNIGIRIEETLNIFTGDTDGSEDTSRILLIVSGLTWFTEHPILGHGINNFRALSNQLFKLDHNFYAHNNYVELLVGVGLIGFLIYYTPIFKMFVNGVKSKTSLIMKIFLFCVLFTDMFWVSYYNVTTQFILCILFIVNKIITHNKYENNRYYSPW